MVNKIQTTKIGLNLKTLASWSEAGYVVDLGNPAKMEQYSGIKETNDLTDAAWLAEQERLGIFPACYIYPKKVRPVRDMLRRRQLLVRQRTQSLLSLQSLLERYGISAPNAQAIKKWDGGDIEKTGLDICVQEQLRALLNSLKTNDREALRLEEIALGFAKPTRDFERVQTVPGIAEVLGLLIMPMPPETSKGSGETIGLIGNRRRGLLIEGILDMKMNIIR